MGSGLHLMTETIHLLKNINNIFVQNYIFTSYKHIYISDTVENSDEQTHYELAENWSKILLYILKDIQKKKKINKNGKENIPKKITYTGISQMVFFKTDEWLTNHC